MLFPDVGDLSDFLQRIRDRATEAQLAGSEFTVVDQVYRDGYRDLYAVYQQVVEARESIEARAQAMDPSSVSHPISGVLVGASRSRLTVDGGNTPSLTAALTVLEAEIATTLQSMYDAFVAYQRTDEESAFDLMRGAQAP